MRLLTQKQASQLDEISINDHNISEKSLMGMAGQKTANFIQSQFQHDNGLSIEIVCGKGNNGGDGFAAAYFLKKSNYNVTIYSLFEPKSISKTSLMFHDQCIDNGIKILYGSKVPNKSPKCEIIIDALLGLGISGQLKGSLVEWTDWMNSAKSVVSIDVPTGLNVNSGEISKGGVYADHTITMGKTKFGMVIEPGKSHCGEIHIVDIGFPKVINQLDGRSWKLINDYDIKSKIKRVKSDTHKYLQGKVLIVAGSTGMTGAAYLSTMAALRSGAGLTITCAPSSLNSIYENKITEGMTLICNDDNNKGFFSEENYEVIMDHVNWCDALVIGPGIGVEKSTALLVEKLVQNVEKPIVIDADGLRPFYANLELFKKIKSNFVITPHLGELGQIINKDPAEIRSKIDEIIDNFVKDFPGILLAKFSPSFVAWKTKGCVNSTGNPALATAGSGDILTGMIASLIAQGHSIKNATIISIFIHGKAADQLSRSISKRGMIASDLLYKIGRTFSDYEL